MRHFLIMIVQHLVKILANSIINKNLQCHFWVSLISITSDEVETITMKQEKLMMNTAKRTQYTKTPKCKCDSQ